YFMDIYRDPTSLYRITETAEKITGEKIDYLFLDEIQNVREWQRIVKSAHDSELFVKIFVTGSNSALLKDDYAVLLSGRYLADDVFPLSFQELLDHQGFGDLLTVTANKSRVLNIFENALRFGSFPGLVKIGEDDLKRELLVSYYDTIVLKDCLAASTIRETSIFREMAHYLLSNIGGLYSYNGLAGVLGSNENTTREFIAVLENSFLMKEVRNFSYSLKQQTKARKKCYCVDNGLIHAVSFAFSENRGRLLENLVYTELVKRGYREIYFSHNSRECDFVVMKGGEGTAIQVAYELNDRKRKRELDGLRIAMEKYDIPRGVVITADQEETISNRCEIIPFWKYFRE
ncbi:MAG: ATP-binding protein, partial [Atribacterota bacterium]